MTERERTIQQLMEDPGYPRDVAERIYDEGDVLSYVWPEIRPGLDAEEGVREYRRADRELSHLAAYFVNKDDTVVWRFLEDAAERAGELALRAERRLEAS